MQQQANQRPHLKILKKRYRNLSQSKAISKTSSNFSSNNKCNSQMMLAITGEGMILRL